MVLLQEREIEYNFIFSGQHQDTIANLRENFGVKKPDVILHKGTDVNSIPKMLFWLIKVITVSLFRGRKIWQYDRKGVVLNHGDTFSTLLGSLLAKIYGHKNAHVESGLRSHNIFHPFPEELTRLAVFALSDIYFAPGDWAIHNLEKYSGTKVDTVGNTLYDSLTMVEQQVTANNVYIPDSPYAIVSLHRFENLYRLEKLEQLVDLILILAQKTHSIFILHSPTHRRLRQSGLLRKLESSPNISLRQRYDYKSFVHLIKGAEFVVTDGGSNQEECYYLGKPCLLLRKATERQEGIGKNVAISDYDTEIIEHFANNYATYKIDRPRLEVTPSETIVDTLIDKYQMSQFPTQVRPPCNKVLKNKVK